MYSKLFVKRDKYAMKIQHTILLLEVFTKLINEVWSYKPHNVKLFKMIDRIQIHTFETDFKSPVLQQVRLTTVAGRYM